MMNNSSSSDRQALEGTNEKNLKITDDESIVDEEARAVETLSVDAVDDVCEIAAKESEDHGETVKLMQDMTESSKDLDADLDVEKERVTKHTTSDSDHSNHLMRRKSNNVKLLNSENLGEKTDHYSGSRDISQFMRFKSHKLKSASRIFGTPRRSGSALRNVAEYRRRLRMTPIPTKQWAYIYHRRLVRQNAFCGSWPNC